MRFDSIPHLIVYFLALAVIAVALKVIYARFLAKKANKNSNEILPTGYPSDSMATAHADIAKFAAVFKAK